MTNLKVSDLTDGGAVQDTDLFYAERAGSQVSISGDKFGGSQPTTREQFGTGASTTVADNANDPLPWGAKFSGDDLLDVSTPTAPTVIAAGVYVVACTFARTGAAMTANGTWQAGLELDEQGEDAAILGDGTDKTLRVGLSLTYYIPAGGTIRAGIWNRDGAGPCDWKLENQIVQRLS